MLYTSVTLRGHKERGVDEAKVGKPFLLSSALFGCMLCMEESGFHNLDIVLDMTRISDTICENLILRLLKILSIREVIDDYGDHFFLFGGLIIT